MVNVVKRFVKGTIFGHKLNDYAVFYRLENGKYYQSVVEAYDDIEARKYVTKHGSDIAFFEFKPGDKMKNLIDSNNYLYIRYMGKAK